MYSRIAELSPQSGSGGNLLLYGDLLDRSFGSVRDQDRHIARRDSPRVRARAAFRIVARVVLLDHILRFLGIDEPNLPSAIFKELSLPYNAGALVPPG